MDAAATLVWIAPDAPGAQQARAIASFGVARSLILAAPRDERPPAIAAAGGEAAAGEVEALLDRARDAIAARDAGAVDRALATAESLLHAHAELPQAAWLMAEVERCRAARFHRIPPGDAEAGNAAWSRAAALDGGRVPGIEERESTSRPAPATLRIAVASARELQAWLDGKPVATTVETTAGPHALILTWDGAPVWARWIDAPAGSSSVAVDLPFPTPCSASDVSRAHIHDDAVQAPDVRCSRWVAALPGAKEGDVRVATCEAGVCGPLIDWHAPAPSAWTQPVPRPIPERDASGRWPAWAKWTAVGAGAAIVTGATVILVEALRPAPVETRFKYGGLDTE